jgi:mono/diheme cytochrome c family protein
LLLWLAAALTVGCARQHEGAAEQSVTDGLTVYRRECLACHMADGRGVPGMTPGLRGSPWVLGSSDALVGYVLTGGFGPAVLMASFDFLTDAEMAAVLAYCREEYGEGAGTVSVEQVARVRAQLER